MTKILFVCLGNICRSPMAEFIMKDIVKQNGRENDFYIASAATSNEEEGNGVYPPIKKLLDARGIDCGAKRAVQITRADYDKYDYIICMENANIRNLRYIIGEDVNNKVSLLLSFTDNPHDVADPWYTRDFKTAESDIMRGCQALFNKLK